MESTTSLEIVRDSDRELLRPVPGASHHRCRHSFGITLALVGSLTVTMFAIFSGGTPDSLPRCTSPLAAADVDLYRLSGEFFRPTAYSIFWGFARGMAGNCTAAVDILMASAALSCDWVWLNADRARILELEATVSLVTTDGIVQRASLPVLELVHHPSIDVVGLRLPPAFGKVLASGPTNTMLALHLTFRLEVLAGGLDGLYVSQWNDDNGKSHNLIASQMEATAARRAFPCVDQPASKATFAVHVGCVDCANFTVLSNMPLAAGSAVPWASATAATASGYASAGLLSGAVRLEIFQQTVKMSTYLIALTIGELDASESVFTYRGNTTSVRCFTTRGSRRQGAYALAAASTVLETYSRQFGVAFPLPKLDMVAIPDFAAGAMENWGPKMLCPSNDRLTTYYLLLTTYYLLLTTYCLLLTTYYLLLTTYYLLLTTYYLLLTTYYLLCPSNDRQRRLPLLVTSLPCPTLPFPSMPARQLPTPWIPAQDSCFTERRLS